MHGTSVVFGERVVLLDDPPVRLPGSLVLPSGSEHRTASSIRVDRGCGFGGVWLPGRDVTVRGRADRATRPEEERRRAEAAQALGATPKTQDEVDVTAADRLIPPDRDELRYAAATLDLATWRYKVQHCPPGPRLAALLDQRPDDLAPPPGEGPVFGAEYDGIPGGAVPEDSRWPDAILTSVVARAALMAHLHAAQYADIADLAVCYPGIHQFLATELAAALHTTDAQAASLLGAAEALRDRLPDTSRALASGDIDDAKAMALVNGTASCDQDVAHRVEQMVLPGAGKITATAVRRRTSRAVIAADPDGAANRHRRLRKERHVYRRPDDDGMARLGVYAPAQDITTMWEAITAVADAIRIPGDTRTLGQRRTDALLMICSDILAAGGWASLRLANGGSCRPRINVTVPYTVLLGHRAPCELAGYGPVTTEQALPLIGTGEMYRMICDPIGGQLLDYGRTRYKPPRHLAEFVRMRDGECPMPTCHHPAARGQLDHVVPAKPDAVTGKPTYGTTCADNLGPPCPHHHLSKDAGRGFMLHRALDGTYTWTTPLGRVYTWRPDPLWHPLTDDVPPDDVGHAGGGNPGGGDGLGAASDNGDVAAGQCTCLPRTGPVDGGGAGDTGRDPGYSEGGDTGIHSGDDTDTPCGNGTGRDGANSPGGEVVRMAEDTNCDRDWADPAAVAPARCDCPESCPCQHGPEPDTHESLEPLTAGGDWADGFRPDAASARDGRDDPPPF